MQTRDHGTDKKRSPRRDHCLANTEAVLTAIQAHWRENAIPPTIRHIQQVTGITSTSLIKSYYIRLEKAGQIKRIKSKPVPVKIYQLLIGEPSP